MLCWGGAGDQRILDIRRCLITLGYTPIFWHSIPFAVAFITHILWYLIPTLFTTFVLYNKYIDIYLHCLEDFFSFSKYYYCAYYKRWPHLSLASGTVELVIFICIL